MIAVDPVSPGSWCGMISIQPGSTVAVWHKCGRLESMLVSSNHVDLRRDHGGGGNVLRHKK